MKELGISADGSFLRIVDDSTPCLPKKIHTGKREKDSGVCQCEPICRSQDRYPLPCRRLLGRRGRQTLTLT